MLGLYWFDAAVFARPYLSPYYFKLLCDFDTSKIVHCGDFIFFELLYAFDISKDFICGDLKQFLLSTMIVAYCAK